MVFIIKKEGEELVGFSFTLANISGALHNITAIPEKHHLNINYIETCGVFEEKYILFMVIDFTDSKVSPKEILEEFKKAKKYVLEVSIAPTFKNIIYPSKFCAKSIGDIRVILFGVANMKGVVEGIKEEFGMRGGYSLLYHLGYGVGEELYEIYAAPLGIKSVEEGSILLRALVRGASWGEIIEYEENEDKIIVKFRNLWECEVQVGKVHAPASAYVKGLITGYFKNILGREPIVEETKCIAAGDPYCQFEIRKIS